MSEGMRSGVNWMRENFQSKADARALTMSVLASPWHADDQGVRAGQPAGQQQVDRPVLADDDLVQAVPDGLHPLGERADPLRGDGQVGIGVRHEAPCRWWKVPGCEVELDPTGMDPANARENRR